MSIFSICCRAALPLSMLLILGCVSLVRNWEIAQSADTIEAYEEFLREHPRSEYAAQAQSRLEYLRARQEWRRIRTLDAISEYEQFVRHFSHLIFTKPALARLDSLYVQRDWKDAQHLDTIAACEEFVERYPQSEFTGQAQARLKVLREEREQWEDLKRNGSLNDLKDFVLRAPQSAYAREAHALIIDYEADLAGFTILEALQKKRIAVQITGSGIKSITLKIKRLVNHQINVRVPVGTFFVCRGSAQNMISREELTIALNDEESQNFKIPAACANWSRDIPNAATSFDIIASPHQEELVKLMPVLRNAGVDFGVVQAAVWIVTDDADYNAMGTLVARSMYQTSGGTRVIQEHEATLAMKLCDQSGIDIMHKAIWNDRKRILKGVKDVRLKNWLGSKSRQ